MSELAKTLASNQPVGSASLGMLQLCCLQKIVEIVALWKEDLEQEGLTTSVLH